MKPETRKCEKCGGPYQATHPAQRYCSRRCAVEAVPPELEGGCRRDRWGERAPGR